MKIDIHAHTRKCKSGDAPTRDITPERFCEILLTTDVGIIAITNHNVFDLKQFEEIASMLGQEAQVWPGVELDVMDAGVRGHLLIIVSPKDAKDFSEAVLAITNGYTPDTFITSIEAILASFESFQPLYVAHHKKKPSLADETLEKLFLEAKLPRRIIKEVTNSISAGIYISHGHASIYGSDVHDWATYEDQAKKLPELRLPVESFEHFCLLLEKDPTTINTVLDRKSAEKLVLCPFSDGSFVNIEAFNDINVIFGPKGTGKSCILKEIAKYYSENGIDAAVYDASRGGQLDEIFDIKGKTIQIKLHDHGIESCSEEIKALRCAEEVGITSISKFTSYFSTTTTNKNAKKILIKEIDPQEESRPKREFDEVHEAVATTETFLTFLSDHPSVRKELSDSEIDQVYQTLTKLFERLQGREWTTFSEWKEVAFLNAAIDIFRKEVERKVGIPAKPTTTGFRDYALNRTRIECAATAILKNIKISIPTELERIGSLGTNKGHLECRTEIKFQNGLITDGSFNGYGTAGKQIQKTFIKKLKSVAASAYHDDLFQCITELNSIDGGEDIRTIEDLLIFKRYFSLNEKPYIPSSGEASMVMLQKELGKDKEVYILDEPEKSLGNEYINDVIVPLIKERARANKKVFISTHDANIAVRTLPYNSVYRCHDPKGYRTYSGNPFANNLVNPEDSNDCLDWKKISMKTLEGGEEAFGERGKIYGNY